jgi:hypothetical protein
MLIHAINKKGKNKKLKKLFEQLSAVASRARTAVINEYFMLCSMHYRNRSMLNQIYMNGDKSLQTV